MAFRWITIAPLSRARAGGSCALLADGCVRVSGGDVWHGPSHARVALPDEVYDPRQDAWRAATAHEAPPVAAPPAAAATVSDDGEVTRVRVGRRRFALAHRREAPSLTRLPSGDLLVTGGFLTFSRMDGELDDSSVGDCELLDVARGEVRPAGRLNSATHRHAIALLPSGAVLIVGGRGGESDSARVEIGLPDGLATARLSGALAARARAGLAEEEAAELVERGDALREAGDRAGALTLLDGAARRFPRDRAIRSALGLALSSLGRHEEALAAFEKARAGDEDDLFAMSRSAGTLVALERHDEALALYREIARGCEADPFCTELLLADARAQIQFLTLRRGRREDFEQAASATEEQLQSSPEWNNKGSAHSRLGQHAEARRCFERALAIDAENDVALSNLASALVQLGEPEAALARCKQTLALSPPAARAAQVLITRGIALYDLGRFAPSVKAYDEAIARDPTGLAWSNRGNSLLKLGRATDALASYDQALGLGFSSAHWGRACALCTLGRLDEAERAAKAAVAANPSCEAELRADPDLRPLFERKRRR